jgi:hypothetical protein
MRKVMPSSQRAGWRILTVLSREPDAGFVYDITIQIPAGLRRGFSSLTRTSLLILPKLGYRHVSKDHRQCAWPPSDYACRHHDALVA